MNLVSSCDNPRVSERSPILRQIDFLDSAGATVANLDPSDLAIVEDELDRLFMAEIDVER